MWQLFNFQFTHVSYKLTSFQLRSISSINSPLFYWFVLSNVKIHLNLPFKRKKKPDSSLLRMKKGSNKWLWMMEIVIVLLEIDVNQI